MHTRPLVLAFAILAIAGFAYGRHSGASGGSPVQAPIQDQDTVTRLRSTWMSIHLGLEGSTGVGAILSERHCKISKLPMANNRPGKSMRLFGRSYKRFHQSTRLTS